VVALDLASKKHPEQAVLVATYIEDEAVAMLKDLRKPPGLGALLRASQEGMPTFVRPAEIGERNATDGLNLLITHFGWIGTDYHAEPAPNLRAFVSNAFVDRHGGNRIKGLYGEVCSPEFVELACRAGCDVLNGYEDHAASSPFQPSLVGITREEALRRENHWLGKLFTYFPPRFYFTEPHRQILLLAREGYTDTEIAGILKAKPDAVKKRWASIYDRVSEVFPTLLPNHDGRGRGSEKRRALLAHLRDRPEELRPYSKRALARTRVTSAR
jgi:hypothetical protein